MFNLQQDLSRVFCTSTPMFMTFFDEGSVMTVGRWEESLARKVLHNFLAKHGPLKGDYEDDYQEQELAFKEYWDNELNDEEREAIILLPNFDFIKFHQITGVMLSGDYVVGLIKEAQRKPIIAYLKDHINGDLLKEVIFELEGGKK